MARLPNGLTHDGALACSLSFSILAASVGTPGSVDIRFRLTPVSGSFCGVADEDAAEAEEVRHLTSQRVCETEAGVFRERRTLMLLASGVTASDCRVFVTAGRDGIAPVGFFAEPERRFRTTDRGVAAPAAAAWFA